MKTIRVHDYKVVIILSREEAYCLARCCRRVLNKRKTKILSCIKRKIKDAIHAAKRENLIEL